MTRGQDDIAKNGSGVDLGESITPLSTWQLRPPGRLVSGSVPLPTQLEKGCELRKASVASRATKSELPISNSCVTKIEGKDREGYEIEKMEDDIEREEDKN